MRLNSIWMRMKCHSPAPAYQRSICHSKILTRSTYLCRRRRNKGEENNWIRRMDLNYYRFSVHVPWLVCWAQLNTPSECRAVAIITVARKAKKLVPSGNSHSDFHFFFFFYFFATYQHMLWYYACTYTYDYLISSFFLLCCGCGTRMMWSAATCTAHTIILCIFGRKLRVSNCEQNS